MMNTTKPRSVRSTRQMLVRDFTRYKYLYMMAIPVLLYFIIFKYLPMYGVVVAFKNFSPGKGIMGSPWVGLKNIQSFFNSVYAWRVIRNTLMINIYGLIFGFPAPIILALLLNELRNKRFKSVVQTVTYLPYFISLVVVCGIIVQFSSLNGVINDLIEMLGGKRITLLTQPQLFRTIYISTGIWQNLGYNAIIYLAAIAGIDQEQYEAAIIDGAGRWKQTLHVTLPSIAPTIIIMLILRIGSMMSVGFEKIVLLYNASTYETADVISSFVYRRGLQEFKFSFSAAVDLFNSLINFTLVILANRISAKVSETSLW